MAKEAYYFSHDTNARRDPKILALRSEHGIEGYGRYWILIEMMAEQTDYMLAHKKWLYYGIATEWHCDAKEAEEFIHCLINDFELLASDGEHFWSESLLRRMQIKESKRKKRVEAGRKGAQARWGKKNVDDNNSNANGNAIAENGNAMANAMAGDKVTNALYGKGKERKEKESKGKNSKNINNNNDSIKREKSAHHVYQENFGTESSIVAQQIEYWIGDLSEELVIEAMKRAVINNVRKFSYVESILKDWDNKGFRSLADVKAGDVDRELAKGGLSNLADDEDFEPVPMINWLKDLDN